MSDRRESPRLRPWGGGQTGRVTPRPAASVPSRSGRAAHGGRGPWMSRRSLGRGPSVAPPRVRARPRARSRAGPRTEIPPRPPPRLPARPGRRLPQRAAHAGHHRSHGIRGGPSGSRRREPLPEPPPGGHGAQGRCLPRVRRGLRLGDRPRGPHPGPASGRWPRGPARRRRRCGLRPDPAGLRLPPSAHCCRSPGPRHRRPARRRAQRRAEANGAASRTTGPGPDSAPRRSPPAGPGSARRGWRRRSRRPARAGWRRPGPR